MPTESTPTRPTVTEAHRVRWEAWVDATGEWPVGPNSNLAHWQLVDIAGPQLIARCEAIEAHLAETCLGLELAISERDEARAELAAMTTDRNGWGDRAQELEHHLAQRTAEVAALREDLQERPQLSDLWDLFVFGAREARANPSAGEESFQRAADAAVKLWLSQQALAATAPTREEWRRLRDAAQSALDHGKEEGFSPSLWADVIIDQANEALADDTHTASLVGDTLNAQRSDDDARAPAAGHNAGEGHVPVVAASEGSSSVPSNTAPLVTPAKSEALQGFLDAWDSGAFKKQYDPEGVLADRMWQAVEQLRDATLVTPEVREAIRRIVCPLVRERKKHRAAMSAVLLQGRPMRQQQVDVDFATLDAAGLLDGKD